jgi:hypothetical protein|uniref:Uncharacterized protein n=1 Tax=viral metagenome TaxID=1070528 RepID=A0A6C0IMI0_9ZZZZ
MSSVNSYLFHNTSRIGSDMTDQTQRNVHNTRFANHTLSNYFSKDTSDQHVNFAVQQPTMNFNGVSHGSGLTGSIVDHESKLRIKDVNVTPAEKVQLFTRPFATVPYLGRGSVDPQVESQLMQGEFVTDKKSASTIMDKSFTDHSLHILTNDMENHVANASENVEEAALEGWVRGGANTRQYTNDDLKVHLARPSHMM